MPCFVQILVELAVLIMSGKSYVDYEPDRELHIDHVDGIRYYSGPVPAYDGVTVHLL
ncbi:MAG: hypothetical protein JEY79_18160 [Pseudodesulfovibrio sp.]|nr:hypothetical protein [Pseudodesulfovibrio sp.]